MRKIYLTEMTSYNKSKIVFPISWDETRLCGCIDHITATGCGFKSNTTPCDFHKELFK